MKKINLIFALILSLMGVTQIKADTVTETFDNWGATIADGWSLLGGATYGTTYGYTYIVDGDYSQSGKALYSNQSSSTSTAYIVTPKFAAGTTVSFGFRKKGSSSSTKGYIYVYTYDSETGTVGTTSLWTCRPNGINEATSKYQNGSFTVGSTDTQYAILIANAVIDNLVYTLAENEVTEGPAFAAYDGTTKLTSPYSYDFGLANSGATKVFTLKNPGTAALNIAVSETGDFGATLSATTIAAGEEVTLTVTMPETTGSSTVTVTPDTDGIDPFVFNVSGTVKDPNKMFIDFADNAIPEDWESENSSTYYSWSFANGYASHGGTSSSYAGTLTSPQLKFAAGEKLYFDTSRSGSSTWYSPSIAVETSTDGTTWTTVQAFTDDAYGTWTTRSVTIESADVKYIRFKGWYINIDNIYGGELPTIANMKVTAEDHNFGMIAEATETTFTIKNSGKAELTGIEVTSDNTAFTISDAPETLAAGAEATVTVTMNATTKGAQSGVITVTAPEQTTATFNVSGYVLDTDVIIVDFAGNAVPEGWTNSGFNVSNNEISTTYNTRTLTSPAITVAEGQKLAIYAKGGSTYGASLTVKTSTNNGETWTTAKEFTTELRQNTTDYVVLLVDNIAAGNYMLQFEGYYVTINTINGYTYNQNAPAMEVTPAEDFAAGAVTAEVSKTYTVANVGTGELTVNIASDSEDFVVSPAQLVITDEPQTFTVTFTPVEGNYGKFSGNITVTPTYDETAAKTIAASATVKDPNLWDEDFEEPGLPAGWEANNWTIGTFGSYENHTPMALAPSSATAGTLITPRLQAKAGDVLNWDAYLNWYDEALIVEYSNDEKATWTQIYNYKTQDDAEAPSTSQRYYHKPMSFTAPADGYYYLRFTSTYNNGVDNFNGFKLATKDHDATITTQNIPATGNQFVEYTATVTVKEMAGKAEELTAKFFIGETQYGDDVVETVEANGTKTFTVTFTPDEAASGEAYFTVTNADLTLETEKQAVEIAAAPVLDEDGDGDLSSYTNFGNYPAVVLKYSLQAGWNTIVLPFGVSDLSVFGEGAKAYSFAGLTDGAIDFKAETSINPQQPYVIYATEAKSEIVFLNVTNFRTSSESADICSTKNGATFQGTYAPVEAPNMAGKYGVVPTTGKIAKGGNGASIKGFRAYFELPEGVNGAKVNYRNEDGTITAIKGISILNDGEEGNVYDLNGRKANASNLPAGVYVKNGKKYVVK